MKSPSKKILVYHHRFPEFMKEGGTPLKDLDRNGDGVAVTTEGKLDTWLHDNSNKGYQSTVKRLHHRTSSIYQVDLLTSDQVKEASSKVTHEQNVGSIKVALLGWHVKRYRELYIISHSSDTLPAVEIEIKREEAGKAEAAET